jgi:CheY-like chemotaxis protein
MPRYDSGALAREDDDLTIDVMFESDDEPSGMNALPVTPLEEDNAPTLAPPPLEAEAEAEQSGVRALPAPPPELEVEAPPASLPGAAVPFAFVKGAPVVLLVDDEPLIRRHVANALSVKYTVYEASDGAEGLATLARMPRPDCIVCDVNMPRLGGVQFARALKMLAPMRGVPVAFLSSSRDPRAVCDAINAGAKPFLSKKDTPAHILAKLEKILATSVPYTAAR